MCLLIYKPKGVELPEDIIRGGARSNKDSWGIAAILDDGKIHVEKGLNFDKDTTAYGSALETIKAFDSQEAVVHFRITSKGDTSLDNAHPIYSGVGDIYVAHNGTLSGWGEGYYKGHSDTWEFANLFIPSVLRRNEDVLDDKLKAWIVADRIIGSSKFAIISPAGVRILNRSLGHELEGGIWVSNKSYINYTYSCHNQGKNLPSVYSHGSGGYLDGYDDDEGSYVWPGNSIHTPTPRIPLVSATHNRPRPTLRPRSQHPLRRPICCICGDCGHSDCKEMATLNCHKSKGMSDWHICWCKFNKNHNQYCTGMRTWVEKEGKTYCADCAPFSEDFAAVEVQTGADVSVEEVKIYD